MQVFKRIRRVFTVHHDVLTRIVVGAGKIDSETAQTLGRFNKTHCHIGAPLEQPGLHFAMTGRDHHFQTQAVILGKFPRQFVFEPHQFSAIKEIGGRVVAQQYAQYLTLFNRFEVVKKTSIMILNHVFKLQIAIDFADQLRRIFANAPGNIALTAEIGGNTQIVAITQVDFDQITIEYGGIDLALRNVIEHRLGLHTIGDFDDLDIRIALLFKPVKRMPEGRVAIDHYCLAIQITHPLYGLVTLGDDHLFIYVIKRHRKSHLLQPIRVNGEVADSDIPFTFKQRRDQLGKIIDQHQFGNQSMRKGEFLSDTLLLCKRGALTWQVGSTGIIARQQNAQLTLRQDIHEVAVETLRLLQIAVGAVQISVGRQ